MPLTLPFVFLRSNGCGDIELHCDQMKVLLGYILVDQTGFKVRNGVVVFDYANAQPVITAIGSARLVVEIEMPCTAHKSVDNWQVPGATFRCIFKIFLIFCISSMLFQISSLMLLSRRTLKHLRFRHCRLHSQPQTVQFWSAISQCQHLTGLQYEPCRLDKWSRPHLIDALESKTLKSLIVTGIDGLCPSDLTRITRNSRLEELAVVGELINPSVYAQKEAAKMLSTIENLLIQRSALLRVMAALPANGILEVIHVSRGTVSETTKLISYWIRLARDSSREVMLKLEECSQERADAAVGRLLRKARDVTRSVWTKSGVQLQMDGGRLTVLDKRSWFDEHESRT
ncbi:unnamed protein product [Heligmosomoides polygyrus]|uniref:FBD domain-containing protein n=1 Tax=Heligmosomoides polygyrus TaxID=6339 RepID=A0A183F3P5_HELPZ|nr:unnamed protein product [Heligmosomoides polygyrus]